LQPHLAQFVSSVLALLNPLADFAIFLSLTSGRSRSEQRQIGIQAAMAIAVIMIATLWLGNPILTAPLASASGPFPWRAASFSLALA
jgi:small neutral amino acid transporter SnatA (MarC family)